MTDDLVAFTREWPLSSTYSKLLTIRWVTVDCFSFMLVVLFNDNLKSPRIMGLDVAEVRKVC